MKMLTKVNPDLKELLDHIASNLVRVMHCSYALVRKVKDENALLKLVAFQKAENAPEIQYHEDKPDYENGLLIPLTKEPFWYDVADPMSFQGRLSLTLERKKELYKEYDDIRERRFIELISEKAYFPVHIDGTTYLFTLLRNDNIPFSIQELDRAEFAANLLREDFKRFEADDLSGTSAVNEHLCDVPGGGIDNACMELARTLALPTGYNWKKITILENVEPSAAFIADTISFSSSVFFQRSNGESSRNIETVFQIEDDQPTIDPQTQCVEYLRRSPFVLTVDRETLMPLLPIFTDTGEFRPILCQAKELEQQLFNKFQECVNTNIGLWFFLLNTNMRQFLIALSDDCTDEPCNSPVLETSGFLRYMQILLPTWIANEKKLNF